jgi:hypothetical protein
MAEDRSAILKDALKVSPAEVRWHFIADYYDAPISGLAFYRNRLFQFCCFREDIPNHHTYVLHEVTPQELTRALDRKAKFEQCVGTHWSFDKEGKPLPHVLRPEESWKRFYDEEKRDRTDAGDHPIVAWFDITDRPTS